MLVSLRIPFLALFLSVLTLGATAVAENDTRSSLPGVFGQLFKPGAKKPAIAKETKAKDQVLVRKTVKEYNVPEKYAPQVVAFSGYRPGTIVIDTEQKFLYLVERGGKARRYGVAVGSEGLEFRGKATIHEKQEWPRWIPTKDMIKRQPAKYGKYKDGMDGGPENPLGARALYLYQGKVDTHVRIHGTTQPWTIGQAASNGCFRMINEHVIELYDLVDVGTEVVVL